MEGSAHGIQKLDVALGTDLLWHFLVSVTRVERKLKGNFSVCGVIDVFYRAQDLASSDRHKIAHTSPLQKYIYRQF